MPKELIITGKIVEVDRRLAALKYLQDNATTDQLEKLVKLAKNPMYKAMLNKM